MSPKRRPQTGTEWRMLAHPTRGGDSFDIRSRDYDNRHGGGTVMAKQMVLDEVLLKLGDGWIHLEQMSNRQWYIGIGDKKVMVWVDKDGKLTMGEWYE